MVRHITLSEDNGRKLAELSRHTGKTPDMLANEAVAGLPVPSTSSEGGVPDWKQAWRQAAGMWRDRDDIPELMSEVRRELDRRIPLE